MEKRYLKLVIVLAMISCLTACGNKANDSGSSKEQFKKESQIVNFKNGEYIGTGKGFNGDTKVKVKVISNKIKSIDVVSHEDDEEYFNEAKKIIPSIIAKQSLNVEVVSGATRSSNGIICAVKNAINNKDK